jgi:23S rRNA pseudouridine2457 synthase
MVSQFTTNDRHQRNKRFLGELYDFPENSMAVGRLDETTEGLLLITTDGQLSYTVNASRKFEKEYVAQVDGIITEEAIIALTNGVSISVEGSNYSTLPAKVEAIPAPALPVTKQRIRDDRHGPTSWVSITISEGKFRQVRKMCAAVGFPVLRLVRIGIGKLTLENLQSKEVIEVTELLEDYS